MGNRYPSNSVIRVAKQLLVNWKTANGAWSSDYQLVIGLVINSRSIFHRSICWPIRFARCFGGRRIFELLARGESNFKISRDWNSTTGRNFICREGGRRGRKIRIRISFQKGDVEGRWRGRERERFNTLNLVYGRRVKSISAPCSIICPAFISSFRDRDCTSSAMPFAPAANFTSQHFARIYDHFPGYLRIVISQRFSHSKISFTSENVFIYTFDIISNKILILDINFKKWSLDEHRVCSTRDFHFWNGMALIVRRELWVFKEIKRKKKQELFLIAE